MTFDELRDELNRLRGLPFPPVDYQTHWEGLRDMPREALAGAVGRAAKGCLAFPSPAELRALADALGPSVAVLEDRSEPLPEPVAVVSPLFPKPFTITREWRYYHEACHDSGWDSRWCGDESGMPPWLERYDCGRSFDHAPHEWVKPCSCVATNPAIQSQRASQAKYAAQRTTDRKSA